MAMSPRFNERPLRLIEVGPAQISRLVVVARIDVTLLSRELRLPGRVVSNESSNESSIRDPIRCTTWPGRHENTLLSATGGHSTTPAGRASNDS